MKRQADVSRVRPLSKQVEGLIIKLLFNYYLLLNLLFNYYLIIILFTTTHKLFVGCGE